MKIVVNYSASSNITYRGTWEFDVDDQDWAELDEDGRDKLIAGMVEQELANDISWSMDES